MNGIFGNAGGHGIIGGSGRSGISYVAVGCKTTSPLADGAGAAAAALAAPPSLAAADWCSRLGKTTAKATSNAISVYLLDGAIDLSLVFGWMGA